MVEIVHIDAWARQRRWQYRGVLRYGVIGSGAVGGFYGIRLAHAGASVQFLLRTGADDVARNGWTLTSPDGDLRVPQVRVARRWSELDPCDVLVVATKATANDDVLRQLREYAPRVLDPGGGVLLIQNGIGAEAAFARAAAGREVMGGLAFLCAHRVGPNSVAHLDFGSLTIARHTAQETPGGLTPLMSAIQADLRVTGTGATLDDDLVRARWRKLMWNIPFNPLSVILGATTDDLMGDASVVALVRTLMAEVAAAAAAEGRELPSSLPDELLAATAAMAPYATSMKLDADAGRPLEVDAMLGEPLRRAARHGITLPSVAVLHRQLRFLDARMSGGPAATR